MLVGKVWSKSDKLDLHAHEIEDLRRALTNREDEFERAEASKIRVTQEKSEFARNVRKLEADLLRVRKDAERFGNDLKALRRERDKLEEKRKVEEERARPLLLVGGCDLRLVKVALIPLVLNIQPILCNGHSVKSYR